MNLALHETDEEGQPNRIVKLTNKKAKEIDKRINVGLTTVEKVEEIRKDLDLSLQEYALFQECKSLAVAQDLITISEGMAIYHYLGNTPEDFNRQPIAVKAVLNSFFVELLNLDRVNYD